jgi:hypothetical protein
MIPSSAIRAKFEVKTSAATGANSLPFKTSVKDSKAEEQSIGKNPTRNQKNDLYRLKESFKRYGLRSAGEAMISKFTPRALRPP